MARTGRPRQDLRQSPIEHVEAFCCLQVQRIQQKFAHRYGFDYLTDSKATVGHMAASNRYHVMPQNDHMSRPVLMRDALIQTRK